MAAGSVHRISLQLLLPVSSLMLSLLLTGSHALREYETAGSSSRSIYLPDSILFYLSCLCLNSEVMENISRLLSHPINSCSGFVLHHFLVKMSLGGGSAEEYISSLASLPSLSEPVDRSSRSLFCKIIDV